MTTRIFVNLPVKDLNKTIELFANLGFRFEPQFTDENATYMIVSEDIFLLFLVEEFFRTLLKRRFATLQRIQK